MSDTITAPDIIQKRFSTNQTLEGLYLDIPGRVFVALNNGTNGTDVTIESNSQDLLDLILPSVSTKTFGSSSNHSYLNLTHTLPNTTTGGSFLVRVALSYPVAYISTQAQTVVNKGALVNDAQSNVTLNAYNAGSLLYSDDSALTFYKLNLDSSDAAAVQVIAPSLEVAYKLDLSAKDASNVTLAADVAVVSTLKTSAEDAGAVYFQANNHVEVGKLFADAEDAGVINIYPKGSSNSSKVEVEDLGVVNIGSIISQDTVVKATDAGVATVQTTGSLSATTADDSIVYYFNSTPAELPTTHRPSKHKFRRNNPNVVNSTENTYSAFTVLPTPPKQPVAIKFLPHNAESYWTSGWTSMSALPSPTSTSSVGFVGILGLLAAMVFAVAYVMKRSTRVRYQRIQ
ncbi:hypothetical protein THRCLA_02044 [Thraustotheca clavata]|uniref:Uncharacterized protein n=1 Tax=Thraustotheca clavata TaxID=74557 RepID=A0A1W0A6G0_9STRA|nr:hypothetical protein THRCLA_02044 [Thraustotheca clavata]